MKLRNVLFGIMLMFIGVGVVSAADGYFDVKGKDIYQITSSKYLKGSSISIAYKKNANGDIIYCTERLKASVHVDTMRYTFTRELGARYAYVIENGYPNKNIFGDKDKDYFTTSLAIWYLANPNDSIFKSFDLNKGTYNGKDSDVVKAVADLVYGSASYEYVNPSISISVSDKELVLSSDGKYYVSSNISVNESGISNYTVSSDNSDVIITDVDGNVRSSFKYNESFIVKVLASNVSESSSVSVKVSAKGSVNRVYEYSPSNNKYQSVAMLVSESSAIYDDEVFNITVTKRSSISISKQDVTTGKELAGASLELRNEAGEVIYAWISGDTPFVIKDGLEEGKYTLTEVLAPEGYELNKETVSFTVNADGSVDDKVVMYNKPETVVVVPSTSSFKSIATPLIGLMVIGIGFIFIYRNYKKNEEI